VASEPLDLILVGCGLRGTGLVTAVPRLLERRLAIVEAGDHLGPGSFADYQIDSNSFGSDFFGWIDPRGAFGDVLEHPDVIALRTTPGNFRLSLLARALRHAGAAIARRLPPSQLALGDRVVRVDTDDELVTTTLASGRRLAARSVVLATGIRETLRAELLPWRDKVILSSQIVKGGGEPLFGDDPPTPIVIVGGSHSGYSVAMRFHEAMAAHPARRCEVIVVHRAPVKLFYTDWTEFEASERCPLEAIPDPARDVCPETGNLFRYSGLRHGAKALLRAASRQEVPWLRQIQCRALGEAAPWLHRAAVIIQAMGYDSNTLPLYRNGQEVWSGADRLVAQLGADGCLPPGPGRVFVMGMDPYPYRDNSLTPTGQYALRGKQILSMLG
jgi:hypothetical protein